MADLDSDLKLIGGLLGLAAFVWNVWLAIRSYLVLSIKVDEKDGVDPLVRVTISNPGLFSKRISYAALVLSPEAVPMEQAAKRLTQVEPASRLSDSPLSDLYRASGASPINNKECLLIPVPELYGEQRGVGPGEQISHGIRIPLPIVPGCPAFIVRFVVFISYAGVFLRWRYTSDILRAPQQKEVLPSGT